MKHIILFVIFVAIVKSVVNKAGSRDKIRQAINPSSSNGQFYSERDLSSHWCSSRGTTQYRTNDGTYVDCLTDEYAVEAEFDNKWKEAIGQSLHYAESTKKKAAILLIKRKKSNKDYHRELERAINQFDLPIKVFTIEQSLDESSESIVERGGNTDYLTKAMKDMVYALEDLLYPLYSIQNQND